MHHRGYVSGVVGAGFLALMAGPALADSVNYAGNTTGAPTWARPFADGSCCSGLGPVRYVVQVFHISANDTCTINSNQPGFDGFLLLYTDPFNPAAQTVNYVAGNDDGLGGIGTSTISLALTGGTTYQLVTTGFEAGEEGAFTNTITCPVANVTLAAAPPPHVVPTLGETALMILGGLTALMGVVLLGRRRRSDDDNLGAAA